MKTRMTYLAVIGLLAASTAACQSPQQRARMEAMLARAQAGKALFEEKCRTVAGERIYKTVPDVEGVLLMKLRPSAGEAEWHHPMWPGAAFARESSTHEYIETFLGYEQSASRSGKPVSRDDRGYIGTTYLPDNPSNLPGYRFVDVVDGKDGKRYRYTVSEKVIGQKDRNALGVQMALKKDPNYDMNVYRWILEKVEAKAPHPRYGVTFEDHVVPAEREIGVASSTVKVIDLQTNEVLGEMLRYAWSRRSDTAASWLTAYRCPNHGVGTNAATRKFVDQVLLPKKDN